jgi:vacuolar protein sorting-associated protein 13A/C
MNIKVQGLRLILIDDLNDLHLPMLDCCLKEFSIFVSDWSSSVCRHLLHNVVYNNLNLSQLKVESTLQFYLFFFNIRNSNWEPIIEPWDFSLCVCSLFNIDLNVSTHSQVPSILRTKWVQHR